MSLNANRVKSNATSGACNLKTTRGRKQIFASASDSLSIILRSTSRSRAVFSREVSATDEEDCCEESRWIFLRSDEKYGALVDVFTTATHFRSSDLTGHRLQRPITRQRRIAVAHKNVSLGCRNISVETYRRENEDWILDPRDATRLPILSSLSGHFCAFIVLLSEGNTRRIEYKRSTKKNRSTKHALFPIIVLIISVTQSVTHPILVSRAASWLPFPLPFSILSTST